jgi:hypothetical protein
MLEHLISHLISLLFPSLLLFKFEFPSHLLHRLTDHTVLYETSVSLVLSHFY